MKANCKDCRGCFKGFEEEEEETAQELIDDAKEDIKSEKQDTKSKDNSHEELSHIRKTISEGADPKDTEEEKEEATK